MTTVAQSSVSNSQPRSLVGACISAVLTHPMTMAVKRPLRDARWRFKGRGTTNPPMPTSVRSLLFVCLGNICRSPFGAEVAAKRLATSGLGHVVSTSAGLRPSQAARPPQEACEVSRGYGVSLDRHEPQPVTPALMRDHDLVVVVEHSQLVLLRRWYPERADRIVLLSLFDEDASGALERYNILDPFGHPRSAYEACYRRIDRAVSKLVAALPR
jgi:protein-tyrosine phosphatase